MIEQAAGTARPNAPAAGAAWKSAAERQDEIAVVIPVYMGRAFLPELCGRLVAALSGLTERFSIVLVDDRSKDDAWPLIRELAATDRRIKGLQLSRNFGQHYAITAGIDHASAGWYVVMDCDLQDAPEDIPLLYREALKGFDIVVGTRRKEGHGAMKRMNSRLFYTLFNALSGVDLDWSVGNFRIFSERVAAGFRDMREQMRCLPASLSFMGFEVVSVALPHHPRAEGKSSYTLAKLISLAGGTILAHSQAPLKLATIFGFAITVLAFCAALLIVLLFLLGDVNVPGWASLVVAILVVGGIQIFITGVVGIYVGRCFEEAKRRPLYFVRNTVNL